MWGYGNKDRHVNYHIVTECTWDTCKTDSEWQWNRPSHFRPHREWTPKAAIPRIVPWWSGVWSPRQQYCGRWISVDMDGIIEPLRNELWYRSYVGILPYMERKSRIPYERLVNIFRIMGQVPKMISNTRNKVINWTNRNCSRACTGTRLKERKHQGFLTLY